MFLSGTNVEEAKRILRESGCNVESTSDLDKAAQAAVKSIQA